MVRSTDTKKSVRLATACTECQRRKQKASTDIQRCAVGNGHAINHCQGRRIAHLCKFTPKKVLKAAKPVSNDPRSDNCKRPPSDSLLIPFRTPNTPARNNADSSPDSLSSNSVSAIASGDGFRMLGYLPDNENVLQGGTDQYQSAAISPLPRGNLSPELEKAIRTIPPKPYTDILVQLFLSDMNDQYYCLYPPTFSLDYSTWWVGKASGETLTPEFTCLLLHVCACGALYLDPEARQKLESELGESSQNLAEQYHHTAKQLSNTIAPGKGGLIQVQQLFINAVWYKTEALFIESWHALGAAIHEAQELGMHRSSSKAKVSEFEGEMRRRLWCTLYTWDWQMSLLLSRPFVINSNYCSFELPNVRLETGADAPSPITHITLQCQLGQTISTIPGVMGGILNPTQAVSIQQETERWFDSFPPPYRLIDPDTRWDQSHPYVTMQRHQVHAIGWMVMLLPLKQCLTKDLDQDKPSIEKSLRPNASHMLPANTKFHSAPFLMFDTAAFLCSAIIHDSSRTLPQRDKVVEAIGLVLKALAQISQNTKTGAICSAVLTKLASSTPLSPEEKALMFAKSPEVSLEEPRTPPAIRPGLDALCGDDAYLGTSLSTSNNFGDTMEMSLSLGLNPADSMGGYMGLSDIPNMDLGVLGQIWDWDNLDLDLPGSPTL
ncbi:hypothetical protein BO70DRAFT_368421 [Aspergillus heteromorphus CBS 117.55]|uniref:Xylanolytic transcriptional activator regulatory domain-containing protein n=1 Tax=Aspergillus heteromorphus CBS 117.55 TaxID=1448321 RepID=A0A317WTJ7_9EURO|nr:uncharacterized protein BO70DRAFT_368421 [Aspergillus heteromorphus CBS 117.55]PWY89724.1 hypothetical protein BO70DRAFT_368421 [Aspergillus heteromorphus CBS 117.55]